MGGLQSVEAEEGIQEEREEKRERKRPKNRGRRSQVKMANFGVFLRLVLLFFFIQSHVESKHFLVKTENSPDGLDGPSESGDYAASLNRQVGQGGQGQDVGVWGEWGQWSECNSTSSNSTKFRFRNCNNATSVSS